MLSKNKIVLALFSVLFCTKIYASSNNYNLRLNPLGLLFSQISGGVDFKIGEKASVGLLFMHYDYKDSFSGNGFGLDYNYAMGHAMFTDGWYVNPNLWYKRHDTNGTDIKSKANFKTDVISLGAKFVYGWYWDNINTRLGFGIQYDTKYVVSPIGLDFEWSLGFAF